MTAIRTIDIRMFVRLLREEGQCHRPLTASVDRRKRRRTACLDSAVVEGIEVARTVRASSPLRSETRID